MIMFQMQGQQPGSPFLLRAGQITHELSCLMLDIKIHICLSKLTLCLQECDKINSKYGKHMKSLRIWNNSAMSSAMRTMEYIVGWPLLHIVNQDYVGISCQRTYWQYGFETWTKPILFRIATLLYVRFTWLFRKKKLSNQFSSMEGNWVYHSPSRADLLLGHSWPTQNELHFLVGCFMLLLCVCMYFLFYCIFICSDFKFRGSLLSLERKKLGER